MKTSSISTERMTSTHTFHHSPEPAFTVLRHAWHRFFKLLENIEIAIVLSEAGDIDGAKALLNKHDK